MPAATEIGPGVWRVPTAPMDLVNSFLLRNDNGSLTLVDAGTRSAPPRLRAALDDLRAAPTDVTRIVLTHAHADHAGGAAAAAEMAGVGITAHDAEAEYVGSGALPATGATTRLGRLLLRLSPSSNDPAPVARTMSDGELLEGCHLRVHHTPGHSPGHCSLLHEPSGTLITGDAIWNMLSRRTWPVLAFCTDAPMTQQTAATLADLDYRTAAFTHGPEIRDRGREAVRAFLARPRRIAPGL
jgi:glyoxylase-like metal-dependent hydrolase (beta-lactamase superfamily II)